MSSQTDVLVIGAGLSGLVAATTLAERGARVVVLDKGRGVGGRLATRRITGRAGTARFDHGAQFFTIRSAQFRDLAAAWPVEVWHHGPSRAEDITGAPEPVVADGDGHPRYAGAGGMTAIAKHLAALHPGQVDVRTGVRVGLVEAVERGWRATWDGGSVSAPRIIVTAPIPQTTDLLPMTLPASVRSLTYDPCVALLATLDGPSGLPGGALELEDGPIHYVADNHHKGVSDVPALTVHASPAQSRSSWDAPDQDVIAALWSLVRPWLKADLMDAQVKRWRYASPVGVHPERAVVVADGLVLAGDIFGQAAVEGAALSGLAAADLSGAAAAAAESGA